MFICVTGNAGPLKDLVCLPVVRDFLPMINLDGGRNFRKVFL
jgi:hypothetical protein